MRAEAARTAVRSDRQRRWSILAALAVIVVGAGARPAGAQCVGDCNGDGTVTINELITGVNIALGSAVVGACQAFANAQDMVDISQLVKGVNNALNGCPGIPAATDTPGGAPTATSVPMITLSGSCAAPGGPHASHGLKPCDAGTPITVFRCDLRSQCLHQEGLTMVGATTVADGGGWSVQIAMSDASAALIFQARITQAVVYRTLGFGSVSGSLRAGRARDVTFAPVAITPVTEAAVQLLDNNGFANYSDTGAQEVISAVDVTTANLSFESDTPDMAVSVALQTASADPTVIMVLQTARNTPTPTAPPTTRPTSTPTPSETPTCVVGNSVVGNGTAASCTDAALNTALSCGGLVTLNCGAAPVTIDIGSGTGTKTISADTTIDGGGLITISGGHKVGAFSVNVGVNFTVQNLTIANGNALGSRGGGIFNYGALTVTNSTFSGNSAGGGEGGGIYNDGGLTVTNSTFSGNSAFGGSGGGIYNDGGLTVTNSTFSGNSALAGSGGGIYNNDGALTVTNSTFSGNSAYNGGGTFLEQNNFHASALTVTNSTFSDNSASGNGGGIYNQGSTLTTVTNSTFSGNSAYNGGGIFLEFPGSATLTLTNTIVANSVGSNCSSSVTDGGHNIEDGDGTTCGFSSANGSLNNTNPNLDPAGLANNGGPTQTIALEAGSPAINAGNEAICAAPPVDNLDQRGFVRPGMGAANCSIGAFEYNSRLSCGAGVCVFPQVCVTGQCVIPTPTLTPPNTPTPTNTPTCVVGTGTSASCTESALDACLPGGGSVTFNCGGAATITVTSTKTISADTTIDGGSLITISGGHKVGVFFVNPGVNFTVQNLTITNGNADNGGGIFNQVGALTVTNSTFSGNSASDIGGGGIYHQGGTLTVTNSTFSGNSASCNVGGCFGGGGGIYEESGTLTITNSTFSGNSALGANGGGIYEAGDMLTVTNSTFSGNSTRGNGNGSQQDSSGQGGGIFNGGSTLTVTNSTFSGNSASFNGSPELSPHGGAAISGGGTVTNTIVTNTIVANSVGSNCSSSVTDGGHNIEDGTTCGFSSANGSLNNTNPNLDPAGLANNGGPTQTIALEAGSPAINAGNEAICAAPPVDNLDQRGFVRPGMGAANCSIGAFEANSVP